MLIFQYFDLKTGFIANINNTSGWHSGTARMVNIRAGIQCHCFADGNMFVLIIEPFC